MTAMEPQKLIKELEAHSEFKEWRKKNPKSFLAHLFVMHDEPNKGIVQVGYSNRDESMTTFFIEKGEVKIATEQEVFKKPDDRILKLDIRNVKLADEEAMEKAEKILAEEYRQKPLKSFLILQNLREFGQIYNITFVTAGFRTLNVKIDAATGNVLKHELTSLMQYKKE